LFVQPKEYKSRASPSHQIRRFLTKFGHFSAKNQSKHARWAQFLSPVSSLEATASQHIMDMSPAAPFTPLFGDQPMTMDTDPDIQLSGWAQDDW
jgi:hypothetical protein